MPGDDAAAPAAKRRKCAGTVLVTGGSRGIGAACCRALAADGWAVAVGYRSGAAAAEAVVAAIRAGGGTAEAVQGDMADEKQVTAVFAEVDRRLPQPLAGLVNNAAVMGDRSTDLEVVGCAAKLQEVMLPNVLGPLACCREAARRMSTRRGGGGGSIVNISSGSAQLGTPLLYAMSKAALNAMQAGLLKELGGQGVRMNAISPGMTHTDMIAGDPRLAQEAAQVVPLGRLADPADIAEGVRWLLSPAAAYVCGANIRISGGKPPGTFIA